MGRGWGKGGGREEGRSMGDHETRGSLLHSPARQEPGRDQPASPAQQVSAPWGLSEVTQDIAGPLYTRTHTGASPGSVWTGARGTRS
jgi:hypothetical protein